MTYYAIFKQKKPKIKVKISGDSNLLTNIP